MRLSVFSVLLCSCLLACGKAAIESSTNPGQEPRKPDEEEQRVPDPSVEMSIKWDRSRQVTWTGGYARVHRLNDGRLMAVYSKGGNAYCKFSSNDAATWTTEKVAMRKTTEAEGVYGNIANAEFAQLSESNPYHPGRIIYAGNLRPTDNRSDVRPYSIVYATSDDAGRSWSGLKTAFTSIKWSKAVLKGCWEPFVLELPNGVVQIYFANETPYYKVGKDYQEISVVESSDGGETWSEARTVCYTANRRDGMPVAMLYEGNIYLAIEHYDAMTNFYPQIVWNPVSSNWKSYVPSPSSYRFIPHKTKLDYSKNYYGAPYLIQTDNYLVLSYQSSQGSDSADTSHCIMEVVVCPKSEIKDCIFTTMRAVSHPFEVDRETSTVLWNSLCHLGGDRILAVSDRQGTVMITPGEISGAK